jgi:multisubunit Na+/H+ antiporter MnhF subunit
MIPEIAAAAAFACAALALPRLARGPSAADRAAALHFALRAIALGLAAMGVATGNVPLVALAAGVAIGDTMLAIAGVKTVRGGPFQAPLAPLEPRP